MRRSVLFLTVLLAVALALPALAQAPAGAPMGPPKVLEIVREEIKPGYSAMHEGNEAAWTRALMAAKAPNHFLAMTSVTGPIEAWFITAHDSFEGWEKDIKAGDKPELQSIFAKYLRAEAEWVNHTSIIAAVYRPDLSYRANVNIAEYRYFTVNRIRVRPGRGREFEEARKMQVAAHERANVDEHLAVFEVVSGAPSGTFLYFVPSKTWKDADTYDDRHKGYVDGLGEAGRKQIADAMANSLLGEDEAVFAFSPRLSYMSEEFVNRDPAFWRPKSAAAAKPAAMKEQKKK